MAAAEGGWRTELGWFEKPADMAELARGLLGGSGERPRSVHDKRTGKQAFVCIVEGRLVGALYLSPEPVLVSRQWAVGLLVQDDLTASAVLAGRPRGDRPDGGAIVCACNSVGIDTIT